MGGTQTDPKCFETRHCERVFACLGYYEFPLRLPRLRVPIAYLTESEDIPYGKMLTDLDHHIIRGILYPAHDLSTEVLLGQGVWEAST